MNSVSRVVDLAGDMMTDRQMAHCRLTDFGGTFVSESGARGDNVFASWAYCEEAREDDERINADDDRRNFLAVEDIDDRSDEFETDIVDDGFDDDGLKDFALVSVDTLAGPRPNPLPKGMTREQAIEKILRFSPLYTIRVYEWAGARGDFNVLNLLPRLVQRLVTERVYTREAFQQTPVGSYSAYRVLKGQVADEQRVIGQEGGIACRIMEILNGRA